jgi:hypothetical protein
MGQLPEQPIFWHLDVYPTRFEAEAAKGERGTVVESFGSGCLRSQRKPGVRPVANTSRTSGHCIQNHYKVGI